MEQSYNTQLVEFLPSEKSPVTMSSREIAELCEKQHAHVMRDIRTMLDALEIGQSSFGSTYRDAQGKERDCYNLPRDLTMTLITGYSIPLRKKVVDRWMELEGEKQAPTPIDFADPRNILGFVGHLQQQVALKDGLIAEQGERLKKLDRLESATGSMCISDAAKTLGARRDDLIQFMSARRWIFKRTGNKNWLAYDDKRKAGYMEHDDHMYFDSERRERVSTRALVTAKGLVKLAELLEQPLH
jgi:phage antirepressor YoqD-like protein